MAMHVPYSLILPNIPNYQDLFSSEDQEILADKKKNILIINDLYNHHNFCLFQEQYKPDYLLPVDLSKQEANAFIKHLKTYPAELSPMQQELVERFKKNVLGKIGLMFAALEESAFQEEKLKILKDESHKIAGSAATYGYKALGNVCHDLDIYFDIEHPPASLVENLRSSLRKMLFAYQKIET